MKITTQYQIPHLYIPLVPLHYQVDPPIFRKIPQNVTFLNINELPQTTNKSYPQANQCEYEKLSIW